MPIYTYRREDGTTFEIRQKFSDDPLQTDPETGQQVTRVVHAAGIVFKGTGFYVNDSKGSKSNLTPPKTENSDNTTKEKSTETDAKPKSEDKSSSSSSSTSNDAAD